MPRLQPFERQAWNNPRAFYFGSVGNLAWCQPFHPPFSTETFVKPSFINARATRALVFSSGQEQ